MRDPRHIAMEMPMNQAGTHYTTPSGDIEPATVEYVIDLLSKTIDNPNTTVSKGKLKHIAAQLLARNALLERENNVLKAELLQIKTLAATTSVTISDAHLTEKQKLAFAEIVRTGTSLSIGTERFPGL